MSAKKKNVRADWSVPLDLERLEVLASTLRFFGEDPVAILDLALRNWTRGQKKAMARLDALLDSKRERRRERDEPHLTAEEKASRAARGTLNEAHRKALRRTLDELGWSVGHKKVSHSKRARQIARADAHKPQ